MKLLYKFFFSVICLVFTSVVWSQHQTICTVELNAEKKILFVQQELIYYNQSNDTLQKIILNDWNNAYSNKYSPLGKRFSDEFVRNFHLAQDQERGFTSDLTFIDEDKKFLDWNRTSDHPDLIELVLRDKILPQQKFSIYITYKIKLPSDKFTGYGYNENGNFMLKDWLLTPANYKDGRFESYSNLNLHDSSNALSDYEIHFYLPKNLEATSDLIKASQTEQKLVLKGKRRTEFSIYLSPKTDFRSFALPQLKIFTNIKDNNLNEIKKALLIKQIAEFVENEIGVYPFPNIVVSQSDYERNPFYGLNQLPAFISPFPDDFIYEIKFLKTYLNNVLHTTLTLDKRKENWIFDGIQVYTMMKYIDTYYPEMKMMGSVAKLKILKSFNIVNLNFNEQYSYFYMLMARKNLDQPISESKDKLIKFNEQIASKYRAGLSLNYLNHYLEQNIVPQSIREFYSLNQKKKTSEKDFENILKSKTNQNIDWFFKTIIHSRDIVDYKFANVSKTNDSITFTIKNKTNTTVPIPVYGLKNNQVIFKKWYANISNDSTFTIARNNANKIVLNYENEVPEFNLRNNWKSLKNFFPNNRPFKFVLMKDLEDPYYNQILYVPTLSYTLYDGISPGIRFHNKTILDKPFNFDVNPLYSPNTQSLTGHFSFHVNQFNRNSNYFHTRYSLTGTYLHYAEDAAYFKFNPIVLFKIREDDFRNNRKRAIQLRQVMVQLEPSAFLTDMTDNQESYNVFNAKYFNTKTELTHHVNFVTDLQLASNFGKTSIEFEYRKLFDNNRSINLRLFAGSFIYNNTNSDFFSFGLDRASDYLFDYNYYGRSEKTGIFSQQLILAEGAFKSKLDTPFANQWMVTTNAGFNIWNWIEVYGDMGLVKNKLNSPKFLYDSGIRLNLVTDYFELYFPVYSSNGWEITDKNYQENIRFIVTLDPRILVNLFTRKWF
ncbi:aminopeptidase [Flavobacterium sp.]|uniref:aminopeptidase n=1 Tax=Flavobacterium sp. TaxID=239 RepID=UPI0026356904|nr:aminopeptidase [Flavobacterium sp.]MDD3004808.1 aminopeptidase [Flavobacterium sp.]